MRQRYFLEIAPKINIVLFVVMIALSVYLLLGMALPYRPPKFEHMRNTAGRFGGKDERTLREAKNFRFDERLFIRADLFPSVEGKEIREEKGGALPFELMGIVVAGERKAVMLKNISEKKEYYCMEGDMIGEFKVQKIMKDRVLLIRNGEVMAVVQ